MSDAATALIRAACDLDDVLELSEQARAAWAEKPITYTSVLALPRRVVAFVAHLHEERFAQLGTRPGRRALSAWDQAVAWCRVMLHDVEPDQIALDTGVARSTAHLRMHESEQIVAAAAPSLGGALIAARAAGHTHLGLDGTLIHTDRVSIPGPTDVKTTTKSGPKRTKVDLWWSGKHHCHGGNIQVITAPDGWPLWVSDVRPGREHAPPQAGGTRVS